MSQEEKDEERVLAKAPRRGREEKKQPGIELYQPQSEQ